MLKFFIKLTGISFIMMEQSDFYCKKIGTTYLVYSDLHPSCPKTVDFATASNSIYYKEDGGVERTFKKKEI